MNRLAILQAALLIVAGACQQQRTVRVEPLAGCAPGDPPASIQLIGKAVKPDGGRLRGVVLSSASREPIDGVVIEARAGSVVRRAAINPDGTFLLAQLSPGRYELVIHSLQYESLKDFVDIPLRADKIEVALPRAPADPMRCAFEKHIAAEPPLALAHPESVQVEASLSPDVRLMHALSAHGDGSVLRLTSRIVNIGKLPAPVDQLCYPSATGQPLRVFHGTGPACYSYSRTLLPGDTLTVVTGGLLRGEPGRHELLVHPIGGSALDLSITVKLVDARRR